MGAFMADLNRLGEDGWEAVGITRAPTTTGAAGREAGTPSPSWCC